jgi:hypothetical protein
LSGAASLRQEFKRSSASGGGRSAWILRDIINSKREAARPQDLGVLGILEATLHEYEKNQKGKA